MRATSSPKRAAQRRAVDVRAVLERVVQHAGHRERRVAAVLEHEPSDLEQVARVGYVAALARLLAVGVEREAERVGESLAISRFHPASIASGAQSSRMDVLVWGARGGAEALSHPLIELAADKDVRQAAVFRARAASSTGAQLAEAYEQEKRNAPRLHEAGKRYLAVRGGKPATERRRSKDEEHAGAALVRYGLARGDGLPLPDDVAAAAPARVRGARQDGPRRRARRPRASAASTCSPRPPTTGWRWSSCACSSRPRRAAASAIHRCARCSRRSRCARSPTRTARAAQRDRGALRPQRSRTRRRCCVLAASPVYWKLCRRREAQRGAGWIREMERLGAGDRARISACPCASSRSSCPAIPAGSIARTARRSTAFRASSLAWEPGAGRVRPKARPRAEAVGAGGGDRRGRSVAARRDATRRRTATAPAIASSTRRSASAWCRASPAAARSACASTTASRCWCTSAAASRAVSGAELTSRSAAARSSGARSAPASRRGCARRGSARPDGAGRRARSRSSRRRRDRRSGSARRCRGSGWRARREALRAIAEPHLEARAVARARAGRARPSPFTSAPSVGMKPFVRNVSKSKRDARSVQRCHGFGSKGVARRPAGRSTRPRRSRASPASRPARARRSEPARRPARRGRRRRGRRARGWRGRPCARSSGPAWRGSSCRRGSGGCVMRVSPPSTLPEAFETSRSRRPSPSKSYGSTRTEPEVRMWSSSESRRSGSCRSGSVAKLASVALAEHAQLVAFARDEVAAPVAVHVADARRG